MASITSAPRSSPAGSIRYSPRGSARTTASDSVMTVVVDAAVAPIAFIAGATMAGSPDRATSTRNPADTASRASTVPSRPGPRMPRVLILRGGSVAIRPSYDPQSDRGAAEKRLSELVDADEVARRVPERAVAHAVVLVGRLLHDVRAAGLEALEEAVEVLRGKRECGVDALRDQGQDRCALLIRDAGVDCRWMQHDRRLLSGGPHGEPAHVLVADVLTDFEPEQVSIEAESGIGVGVGQEGVVDADIHGDHVTRTMPPPLLDS